MFRSDYIHSIFCHQVLKISPVSYFELLIIFVAIFVIFDHYTESKSYDFYQISG